MDVQHCVLFYDNLQVELSRCVAFSLTSFISKQKAVKGTRSGASKTFGAVQSCSVQVPIFM